jgi:hypothetical protein
VRNPFSLAIILLAFFAGLVVSCKLDPSNSTLTGDLTSIARYANILSLTPGQSLAFCGREDQIQAAKNGVAKWLAPLGRNGHIKINECGQNSNLTINIVPLSSNRGADSWYYQEYDFSGSAKLPNGTIEIRQSINGAFLTALILHELGHGFGLCDQYAEKSQVDCVGGAGAPRQNNNEVMGITTISKQQLTEGDLQALLYRAAPINRSAQAWKSFLRENPAARSQNIQSNTTYPINTHQISTPLRTKILNSGDGFTVKVPELF